MAKKTKDVLKLAFEEKKRNKPAFLKDRTPGPMSERNEMEYIRENGIDREDRDLFVNDRKGFRKNINSMIADNQMKNLKSGNISKNYGLIRATKRGEKSGTVKKKGK